MKSIRCHPTERDRWWEGGSHQTSGMPVRPLWSSDCSRNNGQTGRCLCAVCVTVLPSPLRLCFLNCCAVYSAVIVIEPFLSPPPPSLCLCFQVCHHPDCLDLNSKSPLHLCESCDSRCHSENTDNMHFDRHPRFDLQPQGSAAVFSFIW